jgi:hypothetical protein
LLLRASRNFSLFLLCGGIYFWNVKKDEEYMGVTHAPAQEEQGTHTITKQYKVQNTTAAPKKAKSKQQSTAGSFNIYSLNA